MKFIHIADVHLGAVPDSDKPWAGERRREIWDSFRNIIDICNKEKADLLLIAGDLFHKQPLIKELKEVNYCFSRLETARVVIMAGNHDYIGSRSKYPDFGWDGKVYMFLDESLESVYFPDIDTTVYGLSYHKRDITEPLYDTVKPSGDDSIHILLAHGGDEKNIPINRKKLMDAGFDYVALGHIHKPEIISEKMAYAGSLEPLDKNETGPRGYILGEITKDKGKRTEIRFIKSSLREYKTLAFAVNPETTNAALKDMVKVKIADEGPQNIYKIRIEGFRDESIHYDKEALYALGNILEVTDESVPDYDFDTLYRENADNLIGMFIKKIRENGQGEVAEKALYYGIEALLQTRDKD